MRLKYSSFRVAAFAERHPALRELTISMLQAEHRLPLVHPCLKQIPGCDNAYCKYQVVHGEDWKFLAGLEDGITQVTRRSAGMQAMLVQTLIAHNSAN